MFAAPLQRAIACLLCLTLPLMGCATTVKEHSVEGDESASIKVKSYWEHDGSKRYVGGLSCQLVERSGSGDRLVVIRETVQGEPLVFGDVPPGFYKLVVRGGEFEKISPEFRVKQGRRITIRIDVEAQALEDKVASGFKAAGKVAGAIVVVPIALVALVLVIAADDDDDDDDDDC